MNNKKNIVIFYAAVILPLAVIFVNAFLLRNHFLWSDEHVNGITFVFSSISLIGSILVFGLSAGSKSKSLTILSVLTLIISLGIIALDYVFSNFGF